MPRVEPIVDEYQLHRLTCPGCKVTTCATLPPGVPTGHFGPYLQAVLAVFTGSYPRSKRQVQQCRDFQAMIDRGGNGKPIGETLLNQSHRLFHEWHPMRDGPLDWESFGQRMTDLRREVRQTLEEGSKCGGAKTSATCLEILKVEEGLWTFASIQGIEPTNNAAERALRLAVIWRRISGGTDGERGSRFVERTLSVVATCRQQGRNVLEYLRSCFDADHQGQPLRSLLPCDQPITKAA